MSPIWSLLARNRVQVVLDGHDHDYQRWQPLDASDKPDPSGVTEFIVGTGGHGPQTFRQTDSRVAYSNDHKPAAYGVLLLQLARTGASFRFVTAAGAVLDAGTVPCP